jgi:hypothetical protein
MATELIFVTAFRDSIAKVMLIPLNSPEALMDLRTLAQILEERLKILRPMT